MVSSVVSSETTLEAWTMGMWSRPSALLSFNLLNVSILGNLHLCLATVVPSIMSPSIVLSASRLRKRMNDASRSWFEFDSRWTYFTDKLFNFVRPFGLLPHFKIRDCTNYNNYHHFHYLQFPPKLINDIFIQPVYGHILPKLSALLFPHQFTSHRFSMFFGAW